MTIRDLIEEVINEGCSLDDTELVFKMPGQDDELEVDTATAKKGKVTFTFFGLEKDNG